MSSCTPCDRSIQEVIALARESERGNFKLYVCANCVSVWHPAEIGGVVNLDGVRLCPECGEDGELDEV